VIGNYVIKKFLKIFVVFAGIALAVFGGLQNSSIQKQLISCIPVGSLVADFDSTSGIFPFNFTINNLRIENSDMIMRAANVAVELSSRLISIEKLDVHDAHFELKAQTDFVLSDIEYVMPLFVQKMVKNATIDRLQIGNEVMHDICFTYNKKAGLRGLKLMTSLDAVEASWRLNKTKIMAAVKIKGVLAHVWYDTSGHEVNISADCFGKTVTFNGMYLENSLVGRMEVPSCNEKIWSKIGIRGDLLTIEAKADAFFHAIGKVSYVLGEDSIRCEKLSFDGGIRVDPFVVGIDGSVKEVCIFLPEGNIKVTGAKLLGDDFTLGTATFTGISLSQFDIDGMNGVLHGTSVYVDNKARTTSQITNFSFGSLQVKSIDVNAEYSSQELALTLAFDVMKKRNSIKAKILLDNWIVSKNSSVTMETSGAFNIDTYKLPENQEAGGELTYGLKVGGIVGKPTISGHVILKGGHYVNQQLGTYLKDITINCAIDQNVVTISKIYAKDDSRRPGSLDGSGSITASNTGFNVDVGIKIDNLNVCEQSWLEARLFGELAIKGDMFGGARITGTLYTKNPKADISWLIASSTRAVDLIDTMKKDGGTQRAAMTTAAPELDQKRVSKQWPTQWGGYPIDVAFEVRPELRITGPDIDSLWNGSARITGSISDIKCNARATLKSGKITVTDNTFGLKSGEISYDITNLYVNVAAEKTVEEKTVGAQFIQKNDVSKVKFYSSPYMSQNDVLSYILFDKSSSEISTSEGFILFSAMNKVTGVDGFGILGKMKTILGIDTITIKKNKDNVKGEDYDAVSIGKQIGKIKVSVDQGAAKDTTGVTVETRVAKNAKITADMSGKNSFGAGISWSKRY
jgi:hypothetical protein